MEWERANKSTGIPLKSWCADIEEGALEQAEDLQNHPMVVHHVAVMPDCHQGYGMPIGGVIACKSAVIPNAVGVDIGCGMGALQTNLRAGELDIQEIRSVMELVKKTVPVGFYRHKKDQKWKGFNDAKPHWMDKHSWQVAKESLGTLGGGNHFIELQAGEDGFIWLMIHSGSRNLGKTIADYFHKKAQDLNETYNMPIPNRDLAYLPVDSEIGQAYIKDMNLALSFAMENRKRIMDAFIAALQQMRPFTAGKIVNIHHNYAALEKHFGEKLWIHRKGATSAKKKELGIIPGSMGTPSYIVEGLENKDSFHSCSHGAGRRMGRLNATLKLTKNECDQAMKGIVCDRWHKIRFGKLKGHHDFGEAPAAYKDIDAVIRSQLDLIKPLVRLKPLGVIKG